TNRMNTVYAGSVARCCILASETEAALGQAYNATYDGAITQREWLYLWADTFRVARPARRVPYALAFQAGFLLEMAYRLMGAKKPPLITRYSAWLLGRPTFYLSHKAEQQLGWKPVVTYQEGVQKTVDWYLRTSNQIRG
ncbi:MAG TPA: hypothetical protein PKD72_02375, partial [Gemmatales bacterium]|nr:hypothetical protein [Gemmatales bacterium]